MMKPSYKLQKCKEKASMEHFMEQLFIMNLIIMVRIPPKKQRTKPGLAFSELEVSGKGNTERIPDMFPTVLDAPCRSPHHQVTMGHRTTTVIQGRKWRLRNRSLSNRLISTRVGLEFRHV